MKKNFFSLVSILILLSCSQAPSDSAIQTAIAQTQIAIPTLTTIPTVLPVPVSEIDLDEILIQAGDLPPGFSGGQIRSLAPEGLKCSKTIDAKKTVFQQLAKNGGPNGGVSVFLYDYEDEEKIRWSYAYLSGKLTNDVNTKAENISDIGEKARVQQLFPWKLVRGGMSLVFVRCNAVVCITFGGSTDLDIITSYAKRLDNRLSELVCR